MRRFWMVVATVWAAASAPAPAQPVLDPAAVPGLDGAGRAKYADWLLTNTPRVFALGSNGRSGWFAGGKTLDDARSQAIKLCTDHGGTGCRPYAEDMSIVWPGREWQPAAPPPPLVDGINVSFVPDAHYLWRGTAAARGVVVWGHGTATMVDSRGRQPPPLLRAFNNAGFDVIRFDRAPMADTAIRAAGWLRDELAELRRSGYRVVIAGGQSRGGWNALQMLETPGLADGVIALSPGAHGSGGSTNLLAQSDDLRAIIDSAAPSRSRVVMAQFTNDPFMSDGDTRVRLLERLRPKLGTLLVIDRPAGFEGHFGGTSTAFARQFGICLLHVFIDATPPAACRPQELPPAQ